MSPPVGGGCQRADEPEEGVGQVDPDGVLHTLNATVALCVLLDVHLASHKSARVVRQKSVVDRFGMGK